MLRHILTALILFASVFTSIQTYARSKSATIIPVLLTCEYDSCPLLDIQNPRLTWVNKNKAQRRGASQTAYRIRVAESVDGFDTPVWDTGKVHSECSSFITYSGPILKSRTSYWWQVMVWDEKGRASGWSEPASWHMGILSQEEWKGKWIGAPWQGEDSYDVMRSTEFQPAPLLRREFNVAKPIKEARFYGTGLGYFELYINGRRIGGDYLSPNQTNYDRRPTLNSRAIVVTDPFHEYTVMYLSHDLTSMLNEGKKYLSSI